MTTPTHPLGRVMNMVRRNTTGTDSLTPRIPTMRMDTAPIATALMSIARTGIATHTARAAKAQPIQMAPITMITAPAQPAPTHRG